MVPSTPARQANASVRNKSRWEIVIAEKFLTQFLLPARNVNCSSLKRPALGYKNYVQIVEMRRAAGHHDTRKSGGGDAARGG
jgi:hypothetical protein